MTSELGDSFRVGDQRSSGPRQERSRGPNTGLHPLYRCELYRAGHTVHWIQANHYLSRPHRTGRLTAVDGTMVTVDFGDDTGRYRNHDVQRLVTIVEIGGAVVICDQLNILVGGGTYCFSVAAADWPWTECDDTPIMSVTPEALAERLNTHRGFSVPGELLDNWTKM